MCRTVQSDPDNDDFEDRFQETRFKGRQSARRRARTAAAAGSSSATTATCSSASRATRRSGSARSPTTWASASVPPRIVADLVAEGYVVRTREGRRNRYRVDPRRPGSRHPLLADLTIGPLLDALTATGTGSSSTTGGRHSVLGSAAARDRTATYRTAPPGVTNPAS